MSNIQFFIDSLCETDKYFDERFESKIVDNSTKIFQYFLEMNDVFQNSCLKNVEYENIVINLILCDNPKIHEINLQYRKIDRPTDVISFALFADSEPEQRFIFDGEINLGDIFLSLEQTQIQACEHAETFAQEFYFLVAHSILHLLGFDHQDEKSYNFMMDMQKNALEYINV